MALPITQRTSSRFRASGSLTFLLTLLLVTLWTSGGFASTFVAFGPETFPRSTGEPIPFARSFSVLNPSTQYVIQIQVLGVPSATVSINGVAVIQPSDFDMNVAFIERPVLLQASNVLSGEVRGKPDGTITVQIIGVDNDLPTITAAANPPANANGWNNTAVTVSFTADDATSGVASVTPPVVVATEGANQTVTGTATDRAGNSATASVTVNIDKGPPNLAISYPADGAFLRASSVTVTGSAADALSAVESVVCNGAPASLSGPQFSCAVALTEGTNPVLVEATDRAGNFATSTITVIMDVTPPSVVITSPASGTTVSASPVVVTGTASDDLSGTASVTCNGASATLSGSDFTCEVPLADGPNTIVVAAADGAGNSASQSITVTLSGVPTPPPNAILITPSALALVVDEPRELALVDDYGRPVAGATWSLSDSTLADLSTQGPIVLTGKAAGELTVTAIWQNFSAQAQVTVFAGPELPQGTVRWSVQPAPGFHTVQIVQGSPAQNAPDIYAIEQAQSGTDVIVRALTSDGGEMWRLRLPGNVPAPTTPLAGDPTLYLLDGAIPDSLGGVVLRYRDGSGHSWLIRVDGVTGQQSWVYASGGYLFNDMAIAPSGTIYIVRETAYPATPGSALLKIDVATGIVQQQIPLPTSYVGYKNAYGTPGRDYGTTWAAYASAPMVAPDGSVYLGVSVGTDVADNLQQTETYDNPVQLLQVSPEGATTWTMLEHYTYDGPAPTPQVGVLGIPFGTIQDVIPDGQGGVVAAWGKSYGTYPNYVREAHVRRVSPSGLADYTMPFNLWGSPGKDPATSLALGENGVAFGVGYPVDGVGYVTSDPIVVSFNVADGGVNWSTPLSGVMSCGNWSCPVSSGIVAATEGNGLVIEEPTPSGTSYVGQIVRLDSRGQRTPDTWTSNTSSVQYAYGNMWLATGLADNISAPAILWPWSIWPLPAMLGMRAPNPTITLQVQRVIGTATNDLITSQISQAADYWRQNAGILLKWDGTITDEQPCDIDHWGSSECSDPNSLYEISLVPIAGTGAPFSNTVYEVFRRICAPPAITRDNPRSTCWPNGSELLFTGTLTNLAAFGATLAPVSSRLMNFSMIAAAAPDLTPTQGLVTAHEFGHQLQLPDCSLVPLTTHLSVLNFCTGFNLMYNGLLGPQFPASGLNARQIRQARRGARLWVAKAQ